MARGVDQVEPNVSGDSAPAPGAPGPVRLVYILGAGRCGSTLLDVILGSHPDICSTGELFHFPESVLDRPQPCSCGAVGNACTFWSGVRADIEQQFPASYLKRGRRYESTRSLPRTAILAATPGSSVDLYARRLAVLLRAISAQSQRPIVVDSSKYPSRGLIMWRTRSMGNDVRYIHMVRDGRGLLWSKRRTLDGQGLGLAPRERTTGDLAVWWVLSNVLSTLLFGFRRGRYLRVRYEDLMSDPAATLERIGRFIGVDLADVVAAIRNQQPLPVGHVVGGNRLRFNRALVLKPDTEWQKNLPPEDERTFWGIAGWLARRYGYEAHAVLSHPGHAAARPDSS